MVEAFGVPDWDRDPTVPIAPGGESWSEFVERASGAVRAIVASTRASWWWRPSTPA